MVGLLCSQPSVPKKCDFGVPILKELSGPAAGRVTTFLARPHRIVGSSSGEAVRGLIRAVPNPGRLSSPVAGVHGEGVKSSAASERLPPPSFSFLSYDFVCDNQCES